MQLFSTTRLTGAFAMGAFGILAACSPRKDQTTDTLATTPPAAATTPAPGETTSAWTEQVVDVNDAMMSVDCEGASCLVTGSAGGLYRNSDVVNTSAWSAVFRTS